MPEDEGREGNGAYSEFTFKDKNEQEVRVRHEEDMGEVRISVGGSACFVLDDDGDALADIGLFDETLRRAYRYYRVAAAWVEARYWQQERLAEMDELLRTEFEADEE